MAGNEGPERVPELVLAIGGAGDVVLRWKLPATTQLEPEEVGLAFVRSLGVVGRVEAAEAEPGHGFLVHADGAAKRVSGGLRLDVDLTPILVLASPDGSAVEVEVAHSGEGTLLAAMPWREQDLGWGKRWTARVAPGDPALVSLLLLEP